MQLQLVLKEKDVTLVLLDEEHKVDEKKWVDENNLLEKFFPVADKMFEENNCTINDIDDFILETNIPRGYTTARIARTIIKALNFTQKK